MLAFFLEDHVYWENELRIYVTHIPVSNPEVLSSILSSEKGYPEIFLSYPVPSAKCRDSTSN
jgi:hypothetical protein